MSLEQKSEFTFVWEIKNFSFCTQTKNESLESPVFKAEVLNDTSWYLSLYPRGDSRSKDGYMACFLCRCEKDNGPAELECEFEIHVMSSSKAILKSDKSSHLFLKDGSWGFFSFWKNSIKSSDSFKVLQLRCSLKAKTKETLLPLLIPEIFGTTKIDLDKYSFKWIVKTLNSNCSESIELPCTATSRIEIAVQVPEEYVKITIRKVVEDTKSLSVICRITLVDLEGGKHDSKEALHFFETVDPSSKNGTWEFPNFLKKSNLNAEKEKYLKDDCFVLKCKIEISNGTQTNSIQNKLENFAVDTGAIEVMDDIKRMYKDKIHADVSLVVDGQTIQAHKNILCVRSPVFLAMFGTDMVESVTGTVNIPDLEIGTVNSLLEYIYTGAVKDLDYETAIKLIIAADKYEVLSLKEECGLFLNSILSRANVCDVLLIADMVQHEVLKAATADYIQSDSEHIFMSKQWQNVVKKNLQLATDIFIKVSKQFAANVKKL